MLLLTNFRFTENLLLKQDKYTWKKIKKLQKNNLKYNQLIFNNFLRYIFYWFIEKNNNLSLKSYESCFSGGSIESGERTPLIGRQQQQQQPIKKNGINFSLVGFLILCIGGIIIGSYLLVAQSKIIFVV